MAKTPPFQLLHDLAKDSMEDAFKSVAQAVARQRNAEEQLNKLQQYRHDYLIDLQGAMTQGIRGSQCRNTQHFIDNLDGAILEQSNVLRSLTRQVELEREKWMAERKKMSSMSTLLDRDKRRAEIVLGRREQKMNDEFAARSFFRARMA